MPEGLEELLLRDRSTPLLHSTSRNITPFASPPNRPTKTLWAPILVLETAWFAPFPPAKVAPASALLGHTTVSPGKGKASKGTMTSALTLPTTTTTPAAAPPATTVVIKLQHKQARSSNVW
eukprot:CAMPEP_0173195658 /NCGR_PEP_ID=MMETSP1141-20130122/15183_1 /TAXON_ID=483371 /ORGANISM="non described non described, Strain CCMP2298" /LENGTH=120 /DNA_ID=CAMNT_0014120223 /DNA_START=36 /DNA_END=395 /DNA_ORIENTATION=-